MKKAIVWKENYNFEKLFFNIYDISGRAFIKFQLNPELKFTQLTLNDLQAGLYFCSLSNEHSYTSIQKLILTK